jgi:hypothetical protein
MITDKFEDYAHCTDQTMGPIGLMGRIGHISPISPIRDLTFA